MKTIPLGKIANVATGGTPVRDTPEYWGGSIPWVGTGEIDFNIIQSHTDHLTQKGLDASAAKLLPKGTLLMAMYGQGATRGKVGILGFDAATNQACAAITPKNGTVESEFLFHVLEASYTRIRRLSNIGGQDNLNTTLIREIPIPVLSKPERETVVAAAREWADGIQKTETLLSVLERRKQGLMQQLLTGRRRLKGFKGRWKSVRVSSFANDYRSINTTGQTLPVLSCTKYAGLVDSLQYFNKQVFSENTTTYKIVKRGQFVYATNHIEEGSIGYQDLCDAALVSPMYTVFEPDAAVVNHQFLYMLLKTEAMRRVFEATTHSSVDRRGSLRWPEFAKLKINIPPMPEQERIVEVLSAASRAVDLAKQQLDELKTQKRALMQKLLSGEWHLPEAPTQGKVISKKGLQPPNNVRKQLSKM